MRLPRKIEEWRENGAEGGNKITNKQNPSPHAKGRDTWRITHLRMEMTESSRPLIPYR